MPLRNVENQTLKGRATRISTIMNNKQLGPKRVISSRLSRAARRIKRGRSEKPFLGLLIFARPVFGGAARRCSVVV